MQNNNPTRGDGFLENFLAKKRTEVANGLIPKNLRGGKILDIGCGSYPYFLKNTIFSEKYGIDRLTIKPRDRGIIFNKIDIEREKLPYPENFFETITLLASFEHFERSKVPDILKEINRVLKKEGVLIITTPTRLGNKLLKIMALFKLVSKEEIKEHTGGFSKKEIINYFKNSNFSYTKLEHGLFEFGLNNWFLIKR